MAGKGKYTTYNSPASPRKTFFENLFKGSPFAGFDQTTAIDPSKDGSPVKMGNDILRGKNFAGDSASGGGVAHTAKDGVVDTGDPSLGKVDLTFGAGGDATLSPPNTHEGKDVVWTKAGDPSNSYVPDISSPGPGKTEGTDKTTNPNIKTTDIKEHFVDLLSPSDAGKKLYDSNTLGGSSTLGKSVT